MAETTGAAGIYIPSDGWYLFGGNDLATSQKLTGITSKWITGPPTKDQISQSKQSYPVRGKKIEGQCAIQVC